MFRRILIPTDFSTASEWAFDEGVRIASAHGAELIVLHVRMTKPSHPDELRFPFDPSLYEYAEQQELERLRAHVRHAGVEVPARLMVRRAPDTAAEICATATSESADLIVMATHASHHVAHLIVGSTTRSLLVDSPAPLLAIRYGTRKRADLRRLLVVPSGPGSPALELAHRIGSEVHVVSAAGVPATPLEGNSTAVPVSGNDREKDILRYAAKIDADAIVLDTPSGQEEAMLDIVRHASMPVMVVPSGTRTAC